MWPLLGATVVAVLAFAAISVSQDSTGEYCRSLFQVMLISLIMSWVLAIFNPSSSRSEGGSTRPG